MKGKASLPFGAHRVGFPKTTFPDETTGWCGPPEPRTLDISEERGRDRTLGTVSLASSKETLIKLSQGGELTMGLPPGP